MRFQSLCLAAVFVVGVAAAHGHQLGDISIGHPIAAPTAPGQPNGAVYLTIENTGGEADRLIGLESPAAAAAEIHTMSDDDGVMSMRKLDAVEIAPGAPVHFQPGGLHIMLIGLTAPLTPGNTVPLTFVFEKAGAVTVDLTVEKPAGSGDHGGHNH